MLRIVTASLTGKVALLASGAAVAGLVAIAVPSAGAPLAVPPGGHTAKACIRNVAPHDIIDVSLGAAPKCPSGDTEIDWPVTVPAGPSPSGSPSVSPSVSPSGTPTPTPTTPAPTPSSPSPSPSASGVSYDCMYQTDTWSGDASSVGYSVKLNSDTNGSPSSFSVTLNANKGTTEVVGYPSDQCLLYAALPSSFTSSYANTPPAASSGLDYEFAYDIWLTTASAATSFNWNNDLELMIWTYVNGQVPAGSEVGTLSDGSAVWFAGTKGSNNSTVSVVLPANTLSGTVDLASVISQLKAMGYIPGTDNGDLDVEYGIEAPYGGGQTFAVSGFSVGS